MSHLSIFRKFWEPLFEYENAVFNGEQEKNTLFVCEDGIEKSVPLDHHSSSLGIPRDAKR